MNKEELLNKVVKYEEAFKLYDRLERFVSFYARFLIIYYRCKICSKKTVIGKYCKKQGIYNMVKPGKITPEIETEIE